MSNCRGYLGSWLLPAVFLVSGCSHQMQSVRSSVPVTDVSVLSESNRIEAGQVTATPEGNVELLGRVVVSLGDAEWEMRAESATLHSDGTLELEDLKLIFKDNQILAVRGAFDLDAQALAAESVHFKVARAQE